MTCAVETLYLLRHTPSGENISLEPQVKEWRLPYLVAKATVMDTKIWDALLIGSDWTGYS